MAITATQLLNGGSTSDATSYGTASITPTANRLVLAAVANSIASPPSNVPTLSGNGLTWTQVNTVTIESVRITIFRALGASPTSGSVTIDFAGQTQTNCSWQFAEFAGVNTATPVVQSAVNSLASSPDNSGITVTLAAFGSADNATYGAATSGAFSFVGSGFTQLAQDGASSTVRLFTEWKATNDTTVDWTWGSTGDPATAVAVEIAAFVAPSGPANIKTFDGLATASVKTVNGLAIASVKTKNGLA